MEIMGQEARSLETSADPKLYQINEDGQTQNLKICGYEKFREERIKENLERMKKLGILDLSLKLKNTPKPLNPKNNNNCPSIRKHPQRLSPLPPSGPVRRSSRLGNVTPVSYSEVHLSKKGSFETEAELLRKGYKPEIYTEDETSADPKLKQINKDGQTQNLKVCGYEKFREERIKENLERMKKLGILDLSLKLKNAPKPLIPKNNTKCPSIRKHPQHLSPLLPSGPVRRSSRLGNVTPVSYSEVHLSKKVSFETEAELLREGSKPEVYTEEHEKLLGDTNMSWTLFVDGYNKYGNRIFDPIRGKICHQCRKKTLGHRTQCSQCNKVQGQFCGDCLYMRKTMMPEV